MRMFGKKQLRQSAGVGTESSHYLAQADGLAHCWRQRLIPWGQAHSRGFILQVLHCRVTNDSSPKLSLTNWSSPY